MSEWRRGAAIAGGHLKVHVLSETQYRANFFVQLLQSASQVAGALVAIALVYSRVDELNGWRQPELLAAVGVYTLLGGVMRTFFQPAMMRLMEDVQSGKLDFALTKPADAQLLTAVRRVDVWQALDIVIGAVIISIGVAQMETTTGLGDAFAFAGLLAAGAITIYCVWLTIGAAAF